MIFIFSTQKAKIGKNIVTYSGQTWNTHLKFDFSPHIKKVNEKPKSEDRSSMLRHVVGYKKSNYLVALSRMLLFS